MVDTIGNNIYVNQTQYPADPSSSSTGQSGILALNDPAPTQPTPARSQSVLGSNGTVTFTQNGRTINVFANLQGLTDAPTALVVTSTIGWPSLLSRVTQIRLRILGVLSEPSGP